MRGVVDAACHSNDTPATYWVVFLSTPRGMPLALFSLRATHDHRRTTSGTHGRSRRRICAQRPRRTLRRDNAERPAPRAAAAVPGGQLVECRCLERAARLLVRKLHLVHQQRGYAAAAS